MLHTIHNVILTVFFLKFDCAAKFTDVHTMLQHNNLYQYLSTYKVPFTLDHPPLSEIFPLVTTLGGREGNKVPFFNTLLRKVAPKASQECFYMGLMA